MRVIISHSMDIKTIVKNYYEQFCASKFENFDKIGQFLERPTLLTKHLQTPIVVSSNVQGYCVLFKQSFLVQTTRDCFQAVDKVDDGTHAIYFPSLRNLIYETICFPCYYIFIFLYLFRTRSYS